MGCTMLLLVFWIGSLSAYKNNISSPEDSDLGNGSRLSQTQNSESLPSKSSEGHSENSAEFFSVNRSTKVQDVINNPVFGDYGRLIFPADRTIRDDLVLEDGGDILTWYSNVNPNKTVEIINDLGEQAAAGNQVFYDIYTDEEKVEDPRKEDTDLFFFRGDSDGKVAICNAGGGFVYVGAMQDNFPPCIGAVEKRL